MLGSKRKRQKSVKNDAALDKPGCRRAGYQEAQRSRSIVGQGNIDEGNIATTIDEYTRECLAIHMSRKIKAMDVLHALAELFILRAVPEYLRSDNGSEFTVETVREWLGRLGVKTLFVDPGSLRENGYIESFNGKLGYVLF